MEKTKHATPSTTGEASKRPIFQCIFGKDWEKLPDVLHKHYANRPYTKDVTTVEGVLDVQCSGPFKIFAWLFWMMRGIPPHNESNVPVTVHFESDENSAFFHFNRVFHFKTRKPYHFKSRMIQTSGNEVVEIMHSRLGWKMAYEWENDHVKLKHKGYVLYLFGRFIPMPITFLIGEGYAEEVAVDAHNFDMKVTITQAWWGKIYQYKGRFTIKETN